MLTQMLKTHLPLLLAVLFFPSLVSSVPAHSTLPNIMNVQPDLPHNRLVINGSGFGASRAPSVNLRNTALTVSSFTDRQIIAALPGRLAGNYPLTVANNSNHFSISFVVSIGATDLQGNKGEQGAQGSGGETKTQRLQGQQHIQGPQVSRWAGLRSQAATFDAATCQNLDNTALTGTVIENGFCRITFPVGAVDGYPLPFVSLGNISSFILNADGSGAITVSRTDTEFFFVLITSAGPPTKAVNSTTNTEEPTTNNLTNTTAAPSRTMNMPPKP